MAFTGLAALNDTVSAALIEQKVLSEARETAFMPSLVYNKDISGGGSTVYNFPRLQSVAAAGLTEGTDMDSTAAGTDLAGAITVSEVGVRVDIADKYSKTSSAIGIPEIVALCGRAFAAKIDTDLTALFANASQSVGSSGVALSLQNIEDGLYTLKAGEFEIGNPTLPGTPFGGLQCVLHTRQASHFRTALRSANVAWATPADMGIVVGAGGYGSGFMGVWQNIMFWESTKPATANVGADRVGALFVPVALGMVTSGGITIELQRDASLRTTEVNVTQLYGVGEITDNNYVKIVTKAAA